MAHVPASLLLSPSAEMPSLARSRSSTAPSKRQPLTLDVATSQAESHAHSPANLPPVEVEPRVSQALPQSTTSSRLHVPGTSALHHSEHRHRHPSRHRHTQSDVHSGNLGSHRREKSDGLPHLTAGLTAEKGKRVEQLKLPSDMWVSRANDLRRIASNRSDRARPSQVGSEATNLRRANSDVKQRAQRAEKSRVEMLLDRAEAKKMANRAALSQQDVDKIKKATADAEAELQRRLTAINKTAVEVTRKLDYTYYNLLEKAGNLDVIVQSLLSLSTQSQDLIDGFATEALKVESDVQTKMAAFKTGFGEREARVRRLEDRGARANTTAQDLGTRLENARQKVEAWEKKEGEERWRRSWVWRSIWIVLAVVLVFVFFGLTWREWRSEAELMRVALTDEDGSLGHLHQGLLLKDEAIRRMTVPDDVKSVLSDLQERRGRRPVDWLQAPIADFEIVRRPQEDNRLRALDELLV